MLDKKNNIVSTKKNRKTWSKRMWNSATESIGEGIPWPKKMEGFYTVKEKQVGRRNLPKIRNEWIQLNFWLVLLKLS